MDSVVTERLELVTRDIARGLDLPSIRHLVEVSERCSMAVLHQQISVRMAMNRGVSPFPTKVILQEVRKWLDNPETSSLLEMLELGNNRLATTVSLAVYNHCLAHYLNRFNAATERVTIREDLEGKLRALVEGSVDPAILASTLLGLVQGFFEAKELAVRWALGDEGTTMRPLLQAFADLKDSVASEETLGPHQPLYEAVRQFTLRHTSRGSTNPKKAGCEN